jgi:hypothetical protein
MSKLVEAHFNVAGRLESDNTLFEVCERLTDRVLRTPRQPPQSKRHVPTDTIARPIT